LLLGGAIYSLSHLSGATAWLKHTDEVRVAIERFRSTILAAETATRGFLVAGETAFLEPYRSAVTRWPVDFERVRRLSTDNEAQQMRVRRLNEVLGQRFRVLAEELGAFERGQRGADLTPAMRRGEDLMTTARAILDEMEQEEAQLDAVRQEAAVRRWQLTMVLFVGGAFASLLLLGSVQMQRRSSEARRQRADEVTRAIDGERHLLQAILSGIEDGITLQDRSGRLVFANASAARSIGFPSPEALLAAPPAELIERFRLFDEDGAPVAADRLPARVVLAGGEREASLLVRYRLVGSSEDRWSHIRAYPVFDPDGQLVQAINVFQDVTREHRADERRAFFARAVDELSSSLDYHATLASVARLAVPPLADWCAVDVVEGERTQRVAIAHIDPAKIAFVAELERRYPPDPASTTGVPQVIRSGEPLFMPTIPREIILARAKDARHLELIDHLQLESFMAIPLKIGGRVIGVISFAMAESGRSYRSEDVAFAQSLADRAALAVEHARLFEEVGRSRELLAEQLAEETKRRREAETASRFAERFVGILGHDLRNPLNAISMTARLLARKGTDDPKAVARIVTSADRMSNMVAQLLDLTRSRLAGGITVERLPIRLGPVIVEVLDELRRSYPARDIRFEQRGDDAALADQDRFAQVVSNLVGNAVEHGDPATPVLVTLTAENESLVLAVHNAGPAIPAEMLPIIFDPFARTTVRGTLARGLGLGLFISQQIVLAHGGMIEVTSTAAEGTLFRVTLPRLNPDKMTTSARNLIT
jgi:signal transduction histidine kinase/CHASE3 domain sensor protein